MTASIDLLDAAQRAVDVTSQALATAADVRKFVISEAVWALDDYGLSTR